MRRIPDSERLYELVGQRLERQRRKANLSQTQLARRCRLTRGSIANIESGNQRVTLHTLWTLADGLKVDMRTLIPSANEYLTSEVGTTKSVVAGRLKKAAGQSRSQVFSFIASSRAEVTPNVSREDG